MFSIVLLACSSRPAPTVTEPPKPQQSPDSSPAKGRIGPSGDHGQDERNFRCTAEEGVLHGVHDRVTFQKPGGEPSVFEHVEIEGHGHLKWTLAAEGLSVAYENHFGCMKYVSAEVEGLTLTKLSCENLACAKRPD